MKQAPENDSNMQSNAKETLVLLLGGVRIEIARALYDWRSNQQECSYIQHTWTWNKIETVLLYLL